MRAGHVLLRIGGGTQRQKIDALGCESFVYTPASSNPPNPLLIQPGLGERSSQLAKSDMSGETASYTPNFGFIQPFE